jgi:hypothetical protein
MDYATERQKLGELRELMMEKGIERPDPVLWIEPEHIKIFLGMRDEFPIEKANHRGETFGEVFQKAWAVIHAIPDVRQRGLDRYRKSLAETLKVAHEESIDDALVEPVKKTFDTTRELLLPAPEAAE